MPPNKGSSFLDDVRASTARQGMPCPVPAAIAKVPELAGLLDGSVQWSAIERALANRGIRVPANQLSRHARGVCRCGPR